MALQNTQSCGILNQAPLNKGSFSCVSHSVKQWLVLLCHQHQNQSHMEGMDKTSHRSVTISQSSLIPEKEPANGLISKHGASRQREYLRIKPVLRSTLSTYNFISPTSLYLYLILFSAVGKKKKKKDNLLLK